MNGKTLVQYNLYQLWPKVPDDLHLRPRCGHKVKHARGRIEDKQLKDKKSETGCTILTSHFHDHAHYVVGCFEIRKFSIFNKKS